MDSEWAHGINTIIIAGLKAKREHPLGGLNPRPCALRFGASSGSLFTLQLTNFDNGDRKQERRRKSMHGSIPHSVEKAQRPARIDFQQFRSNKSQILPCIRTLLRQTECHFSTACATTAARLLAEFPNECRAITISRV